MPQRRDAGRRARVVRASPARDAVEVNVDRREVEGAQHPPRAAHHDRTVVRERHAPGIAPTGEGRELKRDGPVDRAGRGEARELTAQAEGVGAGPRDRQRAHDAARQLRHAPADLLRCGVVDVPDPRSRSCGARDRPRMMMCRWRGYSAGAAPCGVPRHRHAERVRRASQVHEPGPQRQPPRGGSWRPGTTSPRGAAPEPTSGIVRVKAKL